MANANARTGPARTAPYDRIAVIGGGAWGTALAAVARRAGRAVSLWARNAELAAEIGAGRNPRYLPDVPLPGGIEATDDLAAAVRDADAVLLVTPSRTVREICEALAPHLPAGAPIAVCAKGIEKTTGLLLAQVATEVLPGHAVGALSGPSFAIETVKGYPTAVTVAFPFTYEERLDPHASTAARFAVSLSSDVFRVYVTDDLTGVEVGGAVKNVIAIACGMMTGAGFAENTRAALITRGIDEMKTLAQALGGRRETVTGLSGAGDLTLTCSSQTSRNMSLGFQLGQGIPRAECFDGKPVVVEGEVNAVSVIDLARRVGIDMPICEAVHAILHDGAAPGETFAQLWARPIESESQFMDLAIDHPLRGDPIQPFEASLP